ncbi:MAG: MarR family winged helix-turn-helix transcriptional regulator [Porphyromonadaceae bacterium]|nr:MarR family winged helix-turn-helix transcriptional regulator [Porphyromonadaceae bacterium]
MRSKKILLELIEYLELFEHLIPNVEEMDLAAFLTFVDSIHDKEPLPSERPGIMEANIARYLSLLHRYSRTYIKKALQASSLLQTEEEYTYLVCLMGGEGVTKTELNHFNGLEKTSGAEVMRRLRKHGLIEEQPDVRDKRSIRVFITPQGRAELSKVLPRLHVAARALSVPLERRQRTALHFLLDRLVARHSAFARGGDDELLQRYTQELS